MLARYPFSSIERFGLSALTSFQSIVLMVLGAGLAVDKLSIVDYRDQAWCLILSLFVGTLGMLFLFRFVGKAMAPVVNEPIPAWKKIIISVLSSISVGQILWIMGIMVIGFILVMIRECLTNLVDLELVHYWEREGMSNICAPICAGFAFVAMIWSGYKVYRRLSAAELIAASAVGRTCDAAVQKTADGSSVKPRDGLSNKP